MVASRQRIRIRLKSYDHRVLDRSAQQIVETAERTGAAVAGPVPLPTRIRKYTVMRSRFIDKDSLDIISGSTIDFKKEMIGESFVINNPKASSSCGCGLSFSV